MNELKEKVAKQESNNENGKLVGQSNQKRIKLTDLYTLAPAAPMGNVIGNPLMLTAPGSGMMPQQSPMMTGASFTPSPNQQFGGF